MIWASPSYITLAIWVRVRVRVTEDAHITRVLGMRMPKTRGCPYLCDRGKGRSEGASVLVYIGKCSLVIERC